MCFFIVYCWCLLFVVCIWPKNIYCVLMCFGWVNLSQKPSQLNQLTTFWFRSTVRPIAARPQAWVNVCGIHCHSVATKHHIACISQYLWHNPAAKKPWNCDESSGIARDQNDEVMPVVFDRWTGQKSKCHRESQVWQHQKVR